MRRGCGAGLRGTGDDGTEASPGGIRRHAHPEQGRSRQPRKRSSGSKHGSTTGSIAIASSRHPAEMCRWKSCCRSAGSIPLADSMPPSSATIDQPHSHRNGHTKASGRGATKQESLSPWTHCGKPPAGSRPAFTDAKAWCMPLKNRADGSSFKVVGKRVDISVGDEWNGRQPRTRIIAIGAHDGVDASSAARSV